LLLFHREPVAEPEVSKDQDYKDYNGPDAGLDACASQMLIKLCQSAAFLGF
jgi:hypothetical protein